MPLPSRRKAAAALRGRHIAAAGSLVVRKPPRPRASRTTRDPRKPRRFIDGAPAASVDRHRQDKRTPSRRADSRSHLNPLAPWAACRISLSSIAFRFHFRFLLSSNISFFAFLFARLREYFDVGVHPKSARCVRRATPACSPSRAACIRATSHARNVCYDRNRIFASNKHCCSSRRSI